MSIEWSEDLSTGIEAIDNQHKEIILRLSLVADLSAQEVEMEEPGRLVKFLGGYLIDHFNTEEDYMIKHEYPGYDDHKKDHMSYLKNLAVLKRLFNEEGSAFLIILAIRDKFVPWIVEHVKKHDKEMAGFFIKRGVEDKVLLKDS